MRFFCEKFAKKPTSAEINRPVYYWQVVAIMDRVLHLFC